MPSGHGVLLGDHRYEGRGIFVSLDESTIGKDQCGHTLDPYLLGLFDMLIQKVFLAARLGNGFFLVGIFEKLQGFFAKDSLGFVEGLGMAFQGKHLDVKGDIFSFLDDLLHLLMKFGAIRSVGVVKDDHLVLGRLVAHDEGVIERHL